MSDTTGDIQPDATCDNGAEKTVGALVRALDEAVPFASAEEWDNVGLICGDPENVVSGCWISLNPTPGIIDFVARAQGNVLVTHHPPFLDAPKRFVPLSCEGGSMAGESIRLALGAGISIISLHTNLDASPLLQERLAASYGLVYDHAFQNLGEGRAYGQVAHMRTDRNTLEELSHWIAESTGSMPRVWGNRYQRIGKIAIINGSASSFVDEVRAQRISCVVVGELGYHVSLDLASQGVAIVEVGHDVSELPLLPVLQQLVLDAGVQSDIITDIGPHEFWWQPT